MEDVHSGIEPLGPAIIATQRLIKSLYLLVKDSEDFGGRVAVLELGGEGMGKKILLRTPFVRFQGIVKDQLEIG
jgi:hypothetical protein